MPGPHEVTVDGGRHGTPILPRRRRFRVEASKPAIQPELSLSPARSTRLERSSSVASAKRSSTVPDESTARRHSIHRMEQRD
jgi:hypothetical protein